LGLGALLAIAGFGMRGDPGTEATSAKPAPSGAKPADEPSAKKDAGAGVSPIMLDLAGDLAPVVNDAAFVSVDLGKVHEQLYQQLGVRLPPIRVRTGVALPKNHYRVLVDEVPTGGGQLAVGASYVLADVEQLRAQSIDAHPFVCPITSSQGARIDSIQAERVKAMGLPVRSARELLCEHLCQLLSKHAALFVGIQEVRGALDALETRAPSLVREGLAKVPLALLTDVLRRLVEESVSIRNLRVLLDALVSPAAQGDAASLAEHCRAALNRQLSHQHALDGPLYAFLVDPEVEEALRQGGPRGAVEPEQLAAIIEGARRIVTPQRTVLLASPDVRRVLRRLLEGAFPQVAILTYAELDPARLVRPMGRLQFA
jgi:type III secretion protein V